MVANTSLFCGVLRYLKRSSPVTSRLSVFLLVNYYGSINRPGVKSTGSRLNTPNIPQDTVGCALITRGFVRGCVIKSTSVDFPDQHSDVPYRYLTPL